MIPGDLLSACPHRQESIKNPAVVQMKRGKTFATRLAWLKKKIDFVHVMIGIMSKFMTKYTPAKNDSLNVISQFGDSII